MVRLELLHAVSVLFLHANVVLMTSPRLSRLATAFWRAEAMFVVLDVMFVTGVVDVVSAV